MQENPHIPQRRCTSSQTLQLKIEKILYCFLKIASRGAPSLHFHMDVKWPFPRQKSLSSVPSGTTPHWLSQRAAFQQDSRMIPFHGQPQTIKCLKPCFHRRWMEPIIPLLPPQILPSTKSHQQNATHLDYTVPHPSKHLTKLDLIKAGSLDDWKKFLQLLWNGWSLSFLQLIRKYLFKSEIVSWSVMSNSLWPHEV